MDIGNKIKELRKQNGWTQQELANRIKVAQNTLSDYERGITAISIEIIDKLAEVFNVDRTHFIDKNDRVDDPDDYKFLFKTIRLIIQDENINKPEDISKEIMGIVESAMKETVRRIKGE